MNKLIYLIAIFIIYIFILNIIAYKIYQYDKNKIPLLLIDDEIKSKYIFNRLDDNEFNNILNKYKNITINKTNIVLISSKIIINNINKSIYSIDTRFNQTIETIESIRKRIPDVCIIIIDNSDFTNNKNYLDTLELKCDIVLNPINNLKLNNATNSSNSSIGETYQIIYFLDIFNQLNIKYKQFFKISGRYLINDEFVYSKYKSDKLIFKFSEWSERNTINNMCLFCIQNNEYVTSFYKISQRRFYVYINAYKRIYKNIENNKLNDWIIESTLPFVLDNKYIKTVKKLGITYRFTHGRIDHG
jgi:hypothetical protein